MQFSGYLSFPEVFPAEINSIATNALLEGFARDAAVIDAVIIDDLSEELVV